MISKRMILLIDLGSQNHTTGRPDPRIGPNLSIVKDGPIHGISHEITKEANLPTKAGGNHPNNSQLPPPTKAGRIQQLTSLKTLPRHNRPPQLVPQLHQCPSNQNLSRPFPMTNPITTQNRPTVTGRSLHKLQSLPTLSGKAKPSRSANQSLRRKGRSV
jgi:hypothetical protein